MARAAAARPPTATQLLEASIAENADADDPQPCYICDDDTTPGGSLDYLVELMLKRTAWLGATDPTRTSRGSPCG